MPPRLPWRLPSHLSPSLGALSSQPQLLSSAPSPLLRSLPSLFPCQSLSQQSSQNRYASILSTLSDVPNAYNKRIRRGRGPASGKGKTSGRGHKGQKQHGKVPAGFNGGQTKDIVVHGERGFDNIFTADISKVNLDRIQDWINQGRIDPSQPITIRELVKTRCIHGIKDGVKLLGRGGSTALKQPINIIVSRASASAIAAVEAAGGTIVTRYYTRHAIKRILNGRTDPYVSLAWANAQIHAEAEGDGAEAKTKELSIGMGFDKPRAKGEGFQYRLPDPTNRKDIEYYRDPAHRGYLSYLVGDGEGPSLYFTPPGEEGKKTKKVGKKASENRVW
ncbi:YmL10 [Coccidioides posadasii str. Silveira]|uniref:50S ribosomal subunit protein L15 n=3 Tax=Coccidioides posadasii TaxID=199306 RepID=E9CVB6_COCPS|nr:mitochondrial 54S ribosomal protein YmL10/YmL18 [Coccidioides posadasii C735 delta SOWgp]EER24889.1 50S ribosomal protein L15, putative [Coccidioides posadasii C735 delta SOWgp]EFW21254.1 50S ribosomal subunit protein L15 [Coccidioides posadasii str. Silveira]KMM71662.1 50S ribosomal subunit protein L15 [Coccidioides posadasii RMSCC 3488]QVM12839.1 YmL10 [Coccidioides posadasii str. Silveira]|eukprot:XP_003067034.1 mitochondrial 54S ribosomal protein YmL10/YmL18 [Coccidioides posadasii C735 delta SOWgp]